MIPKDILLNTCGLRYGHVRKFHGTIGTSDEKVSNRGNKIQLQNSNLICKHDSFIREDLNANFPRQTGITITNSTITILCREDAGSVSDTKSAISYPFMHKIYSIS